MNELERFVYLLYTFCAIFFRFFSFLFRQTLLFQPPEQMCHSGRVVQKIGSLQSERNTGGLHSTVSDRNRTSTRSTYIYIYIERNLQKLQNESAPFPQKDAYDKELIYSSSFCPRLIANTKISFYKENHLLPDDRRVPMFSYCVSLEL